MNQFDDDRRIRYPLAIFLSSFIFFVWIYFFSPVEDPKKEDPSRLTDGKEQVENAGEQGIAVGETNREKSGEAKSANPLQNVKVSIPDSKPLVSDLKATPQKEETVVLRSPAMELKLSSKNASIISARVLNSYNQEYHAGEALYSPDLEAGGQPGFETGRLVFDVSADDLVFLSSHPDLFYSIVSKQEKEVTFSISLPTGDRPVVITKSYRIKDDPYRVDVEIDINDQATGNPVAIPYYILNGSQIGYEQRSNVERSALDIEYLSYQTGSENEEMLSASFFGSDKTFDTYSGTFDWIALDNRFYARILAPNETMQRAIFGRKTIGSGDEKKDYLFSAVLTPNKAEKKEVSLYYLPKNRALLDDYYDASSFYFFDLFHQFSFMRILSSIMYWFLNFINNYIGNYGWSIILMTIVIKLITLPLTQKSLKSMSRMQELSPKINALKEAHKGNPQRLNTEMMALYQKEGVSPLSGCLPMAIPIPIFIALYSLFQNMVELKGVSFMWVNDLSLPDTVAYLSFSVPFLGSGIKILPIIMTVISFVQALLPAKIAAATPENPQMKGMKYFFPVLFFFICWSLPSGLVLFWTVQNIFSLFQSIFLRKMTG